MVRGMAYTSKKGIVLIAAFTAVLVLLPLRWQMGIGIGVLTIATLMLLQGKDTGKGTDEGVRRAVKPASKFGDAQAALVPLAALTKFDTLVMARLEAELDGCMREYALAITSKPGSLESRMYVDSHMVKRRDVYDLVSNIAVSTNQSADENIQATEASLAALFMSLDKVLFVGAYTDAPPASPSPITACQSICGRIPSS